MVDRDDDPNYLSPYLRDKTPEEAARLRLNAIARIREWAGDAYRDGQISTAKAFERMAENMAREVIP